MFSEVRPGRFRSFAATDCSVPEAMLPEPFCGFIFNVMKLDSCEQHSDDGYLCSSLCLLFVFVFSLLEIDVLMCSAQLLEMLFRSDAVTASVASVQS